MSNLNPVGFEAYISKRHCDTEWRSVTTKADFSGAPDEYCDFIMCTDNDNPEMMRDRLWALQTNFYKDSKGVVRRMVTLDA